MVLVVSSTEATEATVALTALLTAAAVAEAARPKRDRAEVFIVTGRGDHFCEDLEARVAGIKVYRFWDV
jgi:hypothetical protein